jgi:hypothetical protein
MFCHGVSPYVKVTCESRDTLQVNGYERASVSKYGMDHFPPFRKRDWEGFHPTLKPFLQLDLPAKLHNAARRDSKIIHGAFGVSG